MVAGMSPPSLLVSDLDDTLIGVGSAFVDLVEYLTRRRIDLVINSSRPVPSVRSDLERVGLPVAGVIGALGTQIDRNGVRDVGYEVRFDWFPRTRIAAVLERLGPAHAPEFQGPAKVSHAVPREHWRMAEQQVVAIDPRLRVVTSGASNLDVIPRAAGKAHATDYVARRYGLTTADVVTAGDSEIDAEMLVLGRGIAVANATDALRSAVTGIAYVATAPRAAGVLEGLVHYSTPQGVSSHV
jgi:hydroxymethylpyrimidine pyrophosphatase-like HAD family hydrolase